MTDQAASPEAGAQPQNDDSSVENLEVEQGQEQENQGQQEVEQKAQKVVPLAALHEERARVKELRERQRVMEERFSQLQQTVTQRLPPQQEQRVEIPDVSVDPIAHFKAENDQLKRQLEAQGRTTQEIHQHIQQQQQYQRIQSHIGAQIAEYSKEKPDVRDAIGHAQAADFRGLVAVGYDEATAHQMVTRQYDQMIYGLLQQGRNVAESMYALAQTKGYQAKASAEQKLQNTAKVAGASRSLGGGGSVGGKLSLAALAEMPVDEFTKTIGDEAAWRKLWGG